MRRHRFILPIEFPTNRIVLDDSELVHQIRRVLKLKIGEEVEIFNGAGHEAICIIALIDKDRVELEVVERKKVIERRTREVAAYVSVLKRDNFEWAVQKATEIGVTKIVPLISHRTVKLGVRFDRLERIAREAAEQSGRTDIPVIEDEVEFVEALDEAIENHDHVLFFDFADKIFSPNEIAQDKKVAFFIGPEGGFESSERLLAEQKGCLVRSLGAMTLRAETAAVVASYIIVSA